MEEFVIVMAINLGCRQDVRNNVPNNEANADIKAHFLPEDDKKATAAAVFVQSGRCDDEKYQCDDAKRE